MKAGQLDAVTPFLAMHGIAADTAYFGRGEVVIGRRIQLPALRLVYRQEAEQLLVCDLAASVPGSGSRGAVMAFLQLIRLIAAGVPRLRLVRGLLLDSPSDPELNRTRARLSRILEARGACWRQIDGERWLVRELPLSADAGKASHPCR